MKLELFICTAIMSITLNNHLATQPTDFRSYLQSASVASPESYDDNVC